MKFNDIYKDMADKPTVRICSWCQKINDPQFAEYARGIDVKIREEMKVVDQQVKDNKDNFVYTHGVCIPHVVQTYKELPNMTDDRLNSVVNKALQNDPPPCLLTNEPLRHAYMKGLFTPELIQQATKAKHQQQLEERQKLKKLAGIKG